MTEKSSGHIQNGAATSRAEADRARPSEQSRDQHDTGGHETAERTAGAAFWHRRGADRHRAAAGRRARNAWTGAVALAVTGGVLVSASASTPMSGTVASSAASDSVAGTAASGTAVGPGQAQLGRVSQGRLAGPTVPVGVTIGQVLAVLDRAERKLQQDSSLSPGVAQAAAELGMLYTTYQAQQLALAEADEPLRVETAPQAGKARGPEAPDVTAPVAQVSSFVTGQSGQGPARTASQTHTLPQPHAEEQGPGYVTFDEVIVAAMRLANLLDPSSPAALIEALADTESSLRRNLLDTVAAYGGSTIGYANGRIPADVLCPLPFAPGHMLRCDAAEQLTALSAEFEKEFGYPIPLTDSYRSFEMQVAVKGTKPHLAAIPGTSNHGWGLAVDLGDPIAGGSSPEYVWLRLHAPDYGWDNPSWARLDGAKPEPWHFEFFAAGSIPNRAIDPADVDTWAPETTPGHASPEVPSTDVHRPTTSPPAAGGTDGSAPSRPAGGPDQADGGAPGSGGGSSTEPADNAPAAPAEPAEPTPAKPTPSEPPAQDPGGTDPADPGVVGGVLTGAVEVVDGAVEGVVGDVVGGLLGSDGAHTDTANTSITKSADSD